MMFSPPLVTHDGGVYNVQTCMHRSHYLRWIVLIGKPPTRVKNAYPNCLLDNSTPCSKAECWSHNFSRAVPFAAEKQSESAKIAQMRSYIDLLLDIDTYPLFTCRRSKVHNFYQKKASIMDESRFQHSGR